MSYDNETKFEDDLIRTLVEEKGWKDGVLSYKNEKELISSDSIKIEVRKRLSFGSLE